MSTGSKGTQAGLEESLTRTIPGCCHVLSDSRTQRNFGKVIVLETGASETERDREIAQEGGGRGTAQSLYKGVACEEYGSPVTGSTKGSYQK